MGNEWAWDLGADGVVRLVVDEHGVETVYREGRIVGRSPAGGSPAGHTVVLPPRVSGAGEAFREANVPSRELRLRRDRSMWRATLEGLEVAAVSIPDPTFELPRTSRAQAEVQRSNRGLGVIIGLVVAALACAIAFVPVWRYTKGALVRSALTNASHETALKKQWWSGDSNLTVMSPMDFEALPAQQMGVSLERKGNAEAFAAVFVPNPGTTDLDQILQGAVEGGKRSVPPGFEAVEFRAATDGDCNDAPGRIAQGRITSKELSTVPLKIWICVSLRPGVSVGLHKPSVQLFVFTIPELLVERDEPMLRAMMKGTEFKDVVAGSATRDPFGPSKFDAFSKKR